MNDKQKMLGIAFAERSTEWLIATLDPQVVLSHDEVIAIRAVLSLRGIKTYRRRVVGAEVGESA
mgnify:CR=1 FL=1